MAEFRLYADMAFFFQAPAKQNCMHLSSDIEESVRWQHAHFITSLDPDLRAREAKEEKNVSPFKDVSLSPIEAEMFR